MKVLCFTFQETIKVFFGVERASHTQAPSCLLPLWKISQGIFKSCRTSSGIVVLGRILKDDSFYLSGTDFHSNKR